MILSIPADASTEAHFLRFRKEKVLKRLRRLEERALREGPEALDPASDVLVPIGMEVDSAGRITKDSYGVFNLSWQAESHPKWAQQIEEELQEIRNRIKETHGGSLRFLIWAGMGGSAEDKSMYNAVGLLRKGVRCYVLDSTDPAKLTCILGDMKRRSRLPMPALLRRTLVVGMSMGMTSYEPVVNLEKLSALYDRHKIDSRPNFIYMTIPGSLLDQFAAARGYRKIELQLDGQNTTAGRHSGPLTRGSLYPLALSGADLPVWIAGTSLSGEEIHTAWRLAAFLHAHGEAGRDKVTLFLPEPWKGAALWTKQDFEESLGKSESLGIKITIDEKLRLANYRSPEDPRQDRVFLLVRLRGDSGRDGKETTSLKRAGYPVAVLSVPARTVLSRYMQFIHYVVFGIGYLRQMNFVTQPNVELYKEISRELYSEAQNAGAPHKTEAWRAMTGSPKQAAWKGRVTLYYDGIEPGEAVPPDIAPAIYATLLRCKLKEKQVEYGELTFFGDTRYCGGGRKIRRILDRAAERLFRSRLKVPVDVYEGPAMNHSYHEMIIGHGKCFSTILISEKQEQMPALGYIPDYHQTQFLATKLALERRGRAVVAITLKDASEQSLAALDDFFLQAARSLQ